MEGCCENVPNLFSSFVDTFVDFCVTDGMFMPPPPPPPPPPPSPSPVVGVTRFPSPDRLIAIGDIHGDLLKFKQSLRLSGLIDSNDRWSGGSSTLVQVGDVLDRGGQELKILYFLEKLKRQALNSGGNVITMNGNHEIMNIDGDFRYVTKSGLDEFKNWSHWFCIGNTIKSLCDNNNNNNNRGWLETTKYDDLYHGIPLAFPRVKPEYVDGFRSRIAALRPKGPIATRFLSNNLTVAVIGESVFVHGGILPTHVAYGLEQINQEVSDWINGLKDKVTSNLVRGRNSLVWLRIFSNEVANDCDCSLLQHVLTTIPGARRMIMGHTIQESGINGICDNKAIRIDVGMSKGCINGLPEVLEITNHSGVRILTSNPMAMSTYQHQQQQDSGVGLLIPSEQHGPKRVKVEA